MLPRKHPRFAALVAGLAMFAVPAHSQACCLFNCFGHHHRTTFYAPVAAAPACNTCAPQTVSYAPQVAFRPLFTTTPVTALRPVTAVDPCTGCPTTVMQPATAYMQRTVMMPYTTYRPVMQTSFFAPRPAMAAAIAPAYPTGPCGAPATTTYYQPAVAPTFAPATQAPVISQPGCCGSTPAPTFGTPMSSAAAPSLGTAPLYSPGAATPRTFNNTSASPSDAKANALQPGALKPIPMPDPQSNGADDDSTSLPRLLDPQNHTTATTPARPYIPVALNDAKHARTVRATARLDDSGWEAAR